MADVSTFEDVNLPADTVWNVIGDFAGIRKWAVLVQSESVEDTPAGKVRTLVMPENRVVKERLAAQSQYSYTYTMVDRPEMADYRSTVAVVPLDATNCRIELIMHMSASEGQTDEDITARYTRNLRGNLRAMKKALQTAKDFGAEGIKIRCAGRLGGAELARVEQYHWGRVPLHTLRANIDYGFAEANTVYGKLGIKCWICKGDTKVEKPQPQPASAAN